MTTRFRIGSLQADVPDGWAAGAQLIAAAPPDGDRVRPAFSIRRTPLDAGLAALAALVDERMPPGARVIRREPRTLGGRDAIYVELELGAPGAEPFFEHTLWLASAGATNTASALTLSGRAARAHALRDVGDAILQSLDGHSGRDGLRFALGSVRVFLPAGFASDVPVSLVQPVEGSAFRQSVLIFTEPACAADVLGERAKRVASGLHARIVNSDAHVLAGMPAFEVAFETPGPTPLFCVEVARAAPDALHALRWIGAASQSADVVAGMRALTRSIT